MQESMTVGRRAVLTGGCSAACAVALTACAGYGAGGPAPAPAPAPAPDPGGAPAALTAVGDVPVGGGVVLAARNLVVTQPTAGQFKAFSAVCTHQGCTVNEVAGGTISCPCHGSRFAVADGAPTAGPATAPLPETAVAVRGDAVVLA